MANYNFDIKYTSFFIGDDTAVLTITDTQNGTTSATLQAESTCTKPSDTIDYLAVIQTVAPVRWDTLSKEFYGSYDYVGLIIAANKHLPTSCKTSLFAPAKVSVIIPVLTGPKETSLDYLPEWRL